MLAKLLRNEDKIDAIVDEAYLALRSCIDDLYGKQLKTIGGTSLLFLAANADKIRWGALGRSSLGTLAARIGNEVRYPESDVRFGKFVSKIPEENDRHEELQTILIRSMQILEVCKIYKDFVDFSIFTKLLDTGTAPEGLTGHVVFALYALCSELKYGGVVYGSNNGYVPVVRGWKGRCEDALYDALNYGTLLSEWTILEIAELAKMIVKEYKLSMKEEEREMKRYGGLHSRAFS